MTEPGGDADLPLDPDLAATPGRRRADPRVLMAIALGAVPGAAARYGMSRLVTAPVGGFPWATFWTNLSGSFVLGFVLVLLVERFPPARYARAFAATGFLGAYTTFSTFSVEADVLVKDGHVAIAVTYVLASLVAGIALAWAGLLIGRLIPRVGDAAGEPP